MRTTSASAGRYCGAIAANPAMPAPRSSCNSTVSA